MKFAVIVPTYNPGAYWEPWLKGLRTQSKQPSQVLVIDSESTDGSLGQDMGPGVTLIKIAKASFNHGGTRDFALGLLDPLIDIVVFLTQDALLADSDALERLVSAFSDPNVAAAYGRQLPHKNSGPIGAHARLFNYGTVSTPKSLNSVKELGLKTCFISNSFAAYRVEALRAVGGFPSDVILGEDMYVAGKLLLEGCKIQYVADACVNHSHDYTVLEEFRRYFDTGAFHSMEPWLLENFGGASGEGARFVRSELAYLRAHKPSLILPALFRTSMKFLGYKLGQMYRALPRGLTIAFSMHKGFWAGRPQS